MVLSVAVDRTDRAPDVTAILEELLIPTEVLPPGSPPDAGVILVQIPAGQVQQAILGLGLRGFPEVRAYGHRPDQPPPGSR